MTQAVQDGATRPVYYESRVIKLKLDDKVLAQIDAEYDILAQNADEEVIEKSKHELGKMEEILGHEKTINSLVDDILEHYENERQYQLTGKAMIVAYSRSIAMKIYNRILELRPAWAGTKRVVSTLRQSSGTASSTTSITQAELKKILGKGDVTAVFNIIE